MMYQAPIPEDLKQVEYVKLYLHLQFTNSFDLPLMALLQLRRELLQLLRHSSASDVDFDLDAAGRLLNPGLPDDPIVRRVTQKPAVAFVLQPDINRHGAMVSGDRIVLPVLFLGDGAQSIDIFLDLLSHLGKLGIYQGQGRYFLEGLEAEDAVGVRSMIWSGGRRSSSIFPNNDLYWLLERLPVAERVCIELETPMRLLQNGKPAFKADFSTLFPFILRRVSSMLAGHAGVEVIQSPRLLLDQCRRVNVVHNRLRWHDWRMLEREAGPHGYGGLQGQLELGGPELAEIRWILQLGSLLNVGKGAAYGFGRYRLESHC